MTSVCLIFHSCTIRENHISTNFCFGQKEILLIFSYMRYYVILRKKKKDTKWFYFRSDTQQLKTA